LEHQNVRALWDFDHNRIVGAFVCVIFGQLYSEPAGLNANGGIALGIEYGRTAQHFGRDLVLLERDPRMIQRMLRQITQELAE
jgi:pyruvate/2-oxoglutarate dehydrogenase complex dihydrolipoamide dehydrogenase (E3) component